MNFAMSQRQPGRHPVGLMVVVGLHVALGALLLTARLHTPPPPPVAVDLKTVETPPKVQPKVDDKLPPPRPDQLKILVPVPRIDNVEPETIHAEVIHDDTPVVLPPPTVIASIKGDGDRRDTPHFTARHTVLNAGAAQCRPSYPAAAQRVGAEGVSRIRFTVDALGHVIGAQILQASGATREHRLMDKAAAEALAQCPVTMGIDDEGRPVGGTADVEYHWSLN